MRLLLGILLGIVVNFIWGLAFLIPHILTSVDPVLLTAGRYSVYGLLSVALLLTTSRAAARTLSRADWAWAIAFALTGNVGYYALLVLSIRLGGVGVAALIVGTLPVTLAVYGNLRQREFPLQRLAFPLVLISVGLALANGGKFFTATTPDESRNVLLGSVFAVFALSLWTWYGVQNARYLKKRQQSRLASGPRLSDADWSAAIGVCTLALTALALPILAAVGAWSPSKAAVIFGTRLSASIFLGASLVLGVLVSWYATVLWNRVSRLLPVSLVGQLVVFETVSSILYAAVADQRLPPAHEFISMVIILTGVVLGVRATLWPKVHTIWPDDSRGNNGHALHDEQRVPRRHDVDVGGEHNFMM